MRLDIHQRQQDDVTILELDGALILGQEADTLRSRIRKLLKARRVKIILQLEKVARLDSVGIGTILDLVKRSRKAGGDLYLAHPSKTVADVLGLLGLTRHPELLRIYPDEDQALSGFGSSDQAG